MIYRDNLKHRGMARSSILVTGSAGFVGQALVRTLQKRGVYVVGIDQIAESQSDLFIQHDLRQPLSEAKIGSLPPIARCVHLASSVGGFLHNNSERLQPEHELLLLRSVTELLQRITCQRIIYTSSINVFERSGSFTNGPLSTFDQQTPYACGKAQAEVFVADNFKSFAIVRPTNIFGAGQYQHRRRRGVGESHVIPELWDKIQRSPRTVEVLGDGTQERNFLHISDVVSFLVAVLEQPELGWFNLRSDLQLPIGRVALDLLALSGKKTELEFQPEYMRWEPRAITPFDLTPALATGWRPTVRSLREGLLF